MYLFKLETAWYQNVINSTAETTPEKHKWKLLENLKCDFHLFATKFL